MTSRISCRVLGCHRSPPVASNFLIRAVPGKFLSSTHDRPGWTGADIFSAPCPAASARLRPCPRRRRHFVSRAARCGRVTSPPAGGYDIRLQPAARRAISHELPRDRRASVMRAAWARCGVRGAAVLGPAVVRRRDSLLPGRSARPAGGGDRVPGPAVPVPPPLPHRRVGQPGRGHPARLRQPARLRPLTPGQPARPSVIALAWDARWPHGSSDKMMPCTFTSSATQNASFALTQVIAVGNAEGAFQVPWTNNASGSRPREWCMGVTEPPCGPAPGFMLSANHVGVKVIGVAPVRFAPWPARLAQTPGSRGAGKRSR